MNRIGAELRRSGDYISIAARMIRGTSTRAVDLFNYVTSILNMTRGDIHMSDWWYIYISPEMLLKNIDYFGNYVCKTAYVC